MARVPMPGIEQNMGIMDRIVRSAIGGMLVMNFINSLNRQAEQEHHFQEHHQNEQAEEYEPTTLTRIGGFVGGAFIIYGLTGWDPLLSLFNTSTQPGDVQNLFNRARMRMQVQSHSRTNGKSRPRSMREMLGMA